MDASASHKVDNDFNNICGLLLKIENHNSFSTPTKSKNTVIKYTKLPEFEINSKASWPQSNYVLHPRLRRIIAIEDHNTLTSRSLQHNLTIPSKAMAADITKRKIVTISEDDENDLHPRFYRDTKRPNSVKTSNRSVETNLREDKKTTQKSNTRFNITKNKKNPNTNAKLNNLIIDKDLNASEISSKSKHSNVTNIETNENKSLNNKELSWNKKHANLSTKRQVETNVRNNTIKSENEKEPSLIKFKLNDRNLKNYTTKKFCEKNRLSNLSTQRTRSKEPLKDNKSVIVIHVPLDNENVKHKQDDNISLKNTVDSMKNITRYVDHGTHMDIMDNLKDVCIETEPVIKTTDKMTEVNRFDLKTIFNCTHNIDVQTEAMRETFDSLDIPDVTLTKDKMESKNELHNLQSKSLPNLQTPPVKVSTEKENNQSEISSSLGKNTSSYIIRRATVTYTTKQEINFHVVDSNSDTGSIQCPSPLAYPLNVVSVYKKEIKNSNSKRITETGDSYRENYTAEFMNKNCLEELNTLNSYVLNRSKLMKPSDIISSIRVNNGLPQSDGICEQFQRELHFIDSFFESLQYLENSSISNKWFPDVKVDNCIENSTLFESDLDLRNSEYSSLLSKLENGAGVGDTETMASKSLCLLNLLIQDEQRRAKNLLFVLKMREDALKDFTKSQILWLENKKKYDSNNNTAISTLKKKQRGALLKLQHECGEMQRMRKALLTLSEKRKLALMKTKKNIELKLKDNINVEQIILGKKKLRRSIDHTSDRNVAPLKCFDLSSSGCEDCTISKQNSDTCKHPEVSVPHTRGSVKSAEKCIQTGDNTTVGSILTDTPYAAAENFVAVDGGYLNILFHNLSLPQIFSSGKQYEVNEEALKNIVNSTNSNHSDFNDTEVVEKLMEQIKNRDLDRSSSPSTARSLVEEFDQYYKVLTEEEKSSVFANVCANFDYNPAVCEIKDKLLQSKQSKFEQYRNEEQLNESSVNKECAKVVPDIYNTEQFSECDSFLDESIDSLRDVLPSGPLPVPAGEAACADSRPSGISAWPTTKFSTSSSSADSGSFGNQPLCGGVPSSLSLSLTVHSEAEELRRQQLAIEREIKALEQQQCRLLVVREIPDKPPPPYTPPSDARGQRLPRMFTAEDATKEKIRNIITDPASAVIDPSDPFDVFLQDFCQESVERQKSEQSDKPWDACNLLPQKASLDTDQLVKKASSQLLEVLSGVTPVVVSGVGARRSDHIDDILFSEWRRCEPEWTNLHTDEAAVKNQVFESIFQRILTETIDEYKRVVLNTNLTV